MFLNFFQPLLALVSRAAVQRELARQAAVQRRAGHERYLLFQQDRAADRLRIQQQVAQEEQAFAAQRAEQARAREARRRLVPDWDLVELLRQQGRISPEEYTAYCLDCTGEYCPSVTRD